jgi:indolepyruvate ferredoxin oxidoreductase, beta subunit
MSAYDSLPSPYNVIITGVGGQGNVMASRLLGNILSLQGLSVTIGETFGVSQRGGSVMSHVRISKSETWSPQISRGQAHLIIGLEPSETIRVLATYGNPQVRVICNTRPMHPVGVISGDQEYPTDGEIAEAITSLSSQSWLLDSTEAAVNLGNPIFGNIILLGAAFGAGILPIERDHLHTVLTRSMPKDRVEKNLTAFDAGSAQTCP